MKIQKKDTLKDMLEIIDKRLSAIEMMLNINYSPNYLLDDDKVYKKVLKDIQKQDAVSASYIQRRFSLGYARAARMLDKLGEAGIIESAKGSKPRKVIKK